jgi:hypothetical protein
MSVPMSALDATTLLTAWEQGVSQHPLQRAMTLLALACPHKSVNEWAGVSIGERDRQLFQLREELFGSKLEAVAGCPKCGMSLELSFSTRDLQTPPAETLSPESLSLNSGGYEVNYRLPTTTDLLEVAEQKSQARELLLERCVNARQGAIEVPAAMLPGPLVELVGEKMAQADPQAEIQIAMTCPACSHQWTAVFEICSFLWGEIEDWAERLLHDVHSLAKAYGWSERDVISMSARRRRLYLEMAGA